MSNEIKTGVVDVNGAKIGYSEKGTGSPLILIHGGGAGASGVSNYRKNIDAFADRYRVIVPDLPGFGVSENKYEDGPIFNALANVMLGLMDALAVEKADLVGNSLGGGTALKMALLNGDRVGRLVLMGPGGSLPAHTPMPTEGLLRMMIYYAGEGPTREKLKKIVELLVFDPSTITEPLLEERFKASTRDDVVSNPPLRRGIGHADDMLWRAPLEKVKNDVLLVWGREDRVIPLDAYVPLLKALPNASLHVFPNCGHWAQWEKAEQFNALVLNFLAGK